MTLRARLAVGNALFVALLLGGGALAVRWRVRSAMLASVDRELAVRTARFNERPGDGRATPRGRSATRRNNPYRAHRFAPDGRSIEPVGTHPLWDPAAFQRARNGVGGVSEIVRDAERLRVLTTPEIVAGRVESIVQIPYPLTEFDRALRGLDLAFVSLLPFGILGAACMGASLTGRVLRPVRRLGLAVGKLDPRVPAGRLPVEGRDEFAELATTFNALLERIGEGAERQRRFVSDASHELRTPLTALRATLDSAASSGLSSQRRNEAIARAQRSTGGMIRLVNDLLYLSSVEASDAPRRWDRLRLSEVAEAAISDVPGGERVVVGELPMGVEVVGDGDELVRLVANLLSDALRCTREEGMIRLETGLLGDRAFLRVRDSGCGIPSEHLPRLGERFHRIEAARSRAEG
ncbi:MAG: sensor histidine kinase, partial [Armatimonadota bacterium]